MRTVVFGGAGFLGRALLGAIEGGVSFDLQACEGVESIVGDATDPVAVSAALEGADVAALKVGMLGGQRSLEAGAFSDYVRINTETVLHVIAAAERAGVRRILFDSSGQVSGTSGDRVPGDRFEHQARNAYGASKLIAEKALRAWAHRGEGRSAQCFRMARVRAPGTRDVIHHMVRACSAGEPIAIYGDAGKRITFVALSDVIAANLAALERAPTFDVYAIGQGRPVSLLELAKLVMAVVGNDVPLRFVDHETRFEPPVVGLPWEESAARLGWWPRVDLRGMVAAEAALSG